MGTANLAVSQGRGSGAPISIYFLIRMGYSTGVGLRIIPGLPHVDYDVSKDQLSPETGQVRTL